jgi:hypothetical protein
MRWGHDMCSGAPGIITENGYYYEVVRKGVYRYGEDGQTERVIHEYIYSDWTVNGYALYYSTEYGVYMLPHGQDKSKKIYSADMLSTAYNNLSAEADGNLTVTVGKKNIKKNGSDVLVLDGVTGRVLSEKHVTRQKAVLPTESAYPKEQSFTAGDREITWAETDEESHQGVLYENGEPLLSDGATVYTEARKFGEYLVFTERSLWKHGESNAFIVLTPSGKTGRMEIKAEAYLLFKDSTDGYVYCKVQGESEYEVWVICLEELEFKKLELRNVPENNGYSSVYEPYDFVTYGKYLYSCVPWGEAQILWEIVFDESGCPVYLRFADKLTAD